MAPNREPDKIGLTWDEGDGLWIATEDRRGCWASGLTRDTALAALVPVCRDWDAIFAARTSTWKDFRDD